MKGKRIVLSFAVMAMTVAGGAAANEIYKWTDEDGNVYYEDRPSGARTEERLDITYQPTNSSAVDKRVESRHERETARAEAASVAAAAEQEAAENAAAAQARQEKCDRSRARLESYLQSRRLYRTGDDGQRIYLDEAQRQEARQKAEEQITEFCS
ncbi:MAG: DUF4124 domain-containing protein [Gammaproteobacteria bacterium]|jgi:hypothetical protein|nr:DUF4124 domain-containing protein [Gammaproteobacteria bacterium]